MTEGGDESRLVVGVSIDVFEGSEGNAFSSIMFLIFFRLPLSSRN